MKHFIDVDEIVRVRKEHLKTADALSTVIEHIDALNEDFDEEYVRGYLFGMRHACLKIAQDLGEFEHTDEV